MIERVSKYRNALMGISILWIMVHHSGLNLPNPVFALKRTGYAGVDIFMFLSGLGCAVSLRNNNNSVGFYIRRLKRIYPHYIPILLVFLIINLSSASITEWIRNVLGNVTGFTYWASYGCRFNWYIPAIIVFYLLTPIFFEILKQYDLKGLTALLVLQFIAGFCFAYNTDLLIAVSRFPIYTIGLLAGIRLNINNSLVQKNKDTVKECLYALGCGITGIILLGVMHKYQRIISVDFYNVFWPNILISFAIMYFYVVFLI